MIPKSLNEIEWSDIEGLIAIGREEDDTIEFKSSFKGGSDFLELTESQRTNAVEAIAKEVIAFLNTRGGDVVIGIREATNAHPKAEAITAFDNAVIIVDRLAQSLAARIEPSQSVLGVRAIVQPDTIGMGVIVVRAPASLRAPYRSRLTKDCYVRRGRESVPMPMDEIQDLVITRTARRSERFELLDRQFVDMRAGKVRQRSFSQQRFHIRTVFVPSIDGEIEIDSTLQTLVNGTDPPFYLKDKGETNDVAFRYLGSNWKPILRGSAVENFEERAWSEDDFMFSAKSIKTNFVITTDFVARASLDARQEPKPGVHFAWIVGYLANSLYSIKAALERNPTFISGILRIELFCGGGIRLFIGDRMWANDYALPNETVSLPDFEVNDLAAFDKIFRQAQIDVCALVGLNHPNPYLLQPS